MGMSACFGYGIFIDRRLVLPWDGENFEAFAARRRGWRPDKDSRERMAQLLGELPVEIVGGGDGSGPMWMQVRDSAVESECSDFVDISELVYQEWPLLEWNNELCHFCCEWGIPYDNPHWFLATIHF